MSIVLFYCINTCDHLKEIVTACQLSYKKEVSCTCAAQYVDGEKIVGQKKSGGHNEHFLPLFSDTAAKVQDQIKN